MIILKKYIQFIEENQWSIYWWKSIIDVLTKITNENPFSI